MVAPKKRKRPETSVNFMRAVVVKLQLIKKNQIGKTESQLIEAGFRSKDAIFVLAFFNLVLPIVLGVLGVIIMQAQRRPCQPEMAHVQLCLAGAGRVYRIEIAGAFVRRAR